MSKFDKDSLGTRMKDQYESRTKSYLPRRTYTIIRLDGCHFHTLTRKCARPFDDGLIFAMQETSLGLCKEIQGAKFAYTQSDEISILLTDFETINTEAWFDGQIQKMCSVSASIATKYFNKDHPTIINQTFDNNATFDSRVFAIPDYVEVENYFIWRQQDAVRNSIQMAAQALYSQKELHEVNMAKAQDMCMLKGVNWNDYPAFKKRGTVIKRDSNGHWQPDLEIPIFTQNRDYLKNMIPRIHTECQNEK